MVSTAGNPVEFTDLERAIGLAAVGCSTWHDEEATAQARIAAVMEAAAWVSRLRPLDSPMNVESLITAWSQPTGTWLPGAPEAPLLEYGLPTSLCLDLADDAGPHPGAEAEQAVMLRVMDFLRNHPEGARAYSEFREFLIRNAHARDADLGEACLAAGVTPADVYEPIGPECTAGAGMFYACPRCRWPMHASDTHVACPSHTCREYGSRYLRSASQLIPLGDLLAPDSEPTTGVRRLRFGIWRYTCIPGLEELALRDQLIGIPDTAVEMWPDFDRVDLQITRGTTVWEVDVKDYASPIRLARALLESPPPSQPLWFVIPNTRRSHLNELARRCTALPNARFNTAGDFLRLVQEGAQT